MCCYYRYELIQLTRPMMAMNATNAHVSALLRSILLNCSVNSFSDIITVSAPRRSGRPLLWLSGCPSIVATVCHPLPGVVVHLLFGCFFSCSGVGRPTSSHLLCMVSLLWIRPLFYTILSGCRSKIECYTDIGAMWDGVG